MRKNAAGYLRFMFVLMTTVLFLFSHGVPADEMTDFVSFEIARAYLRDNPYLMANYSITEGGTSFLFKVKKVYMEEKRLMVSGPVILSWKQNAGGQRIFKLPDSSQVYTGELSGNYHLGYYKPMRAAFGLQKLLCTIDNQWYSYSSFYPFPSPELIPGINKNYASWLDQLSPDVKEYCQWWYKNAGMGPPVFSDLIDSVLSVPEGGRKLPPKVYVDYNHCPGEGCTYGEWKTSDTISVFSKPYGAKKAGILEAGETFTAITGNVYVKPIKEIACEPIEVYDSLGSIILAPGRTYYILSTIGEGHVKVWVNGRKMICAGSTSNPTEEWWVNIKRKSGMTGWIVCPDRGCISGSDFLGN